MAASSLTNQRSLAIGSVSGSPSRNNHVMHYVVLAEVLHHTLVVVAGSQVRENCGSTHLRQRPGTKTPEGHPVAGAFLPRGQSFRQVRQV